MILHSLEDVKSRPGACEALIVLAEKAQIIRHMIDYSQKTDGPELEWFEHGMAALLDEIERDALRIAREHFADEIGRINGSMDYSRAPHANGADA